MIKRRHRHAGRKKVNALVPVFGKKALPQIYLQDTKATRSAVFLPESGDSGASNRFILNILGERRWRWVLRGLSRSDAGTELRRLYQPSLLTRLLFPLAYWRYRARRHN